MDMTGEYRIGAPRDAVWAALNDPAILKQCIPGCESLDRTSPTEFTAKVVAKIGPVKATFTGAVTLSDLNPPNGYTITGEGKGGAAGFAKGGAQVTLEPVDAANTLLRYKANASVGGKLAQIGSRLVEGTAKKMSDEFFGNFTRLLGPAEAAAPAPAPEAAAEAGEAAPHGAAAPAPAAATKGLPPIVWVGAVVLIVVILLVIFAG